MEHLKIKVYGRVQGVFFRDWVKEKAQELEINGIVRNEPDGTVIIEAEGKEENLENFIKSCWQGPPLSRVEKVESDFSDALKGYTGFEAWY